MPRRETRHAGIMGDLQGLAVTMEANKDELPQLEPFRLKFGELITQLLEASTQQAALTASKQESSKQLRRLLIEGQSMAHVVRTVVKDHFGPREEKIVEFGLKPFRGRKAKAASEKPAPPTTPPVVPGSAESVEPGE
ncbi:MAG TPA: hypothetical protein VF173_32430 [Thermoanaerobaculia bacterium]|nr:hypothetical protein [Thermoanaerobaculia bacterium]